MGRNATPGCAVPRIGPQAGLACVNPIGSPMPLATGNCAGARLASSPPDTLIASRNAVDRAQKRN